LPQRALRKARSIRGLILRERALRAVTTSERTLGPSKFEPPRLTLAVADEISGPR
jgi:hypothetical protein